MTVARVPTATVGRVGRRQSPLSNVSSRSNITFVMVHQVETFPNMDLRTMTEEEFEREVLAAPGPVLVDFATSWCPPCRVLAPILAAIAEERAGKLRVETVDAEASVPLARRCEVRSFPTVIAFAGGREVARTVG